MTYQAPVDDIVAALKAAGTFDPGMMNADLDEETVRAILEEALRAAKLTGFDFAIEQMGRALEALATATDWTGRQSHSTPAWGLAASIMAGHSVVLDADLGATA